VFRDVVEASPVRGNLVPDAHLATILRQHGVNVLYTNDSDFRKFTFLEVRNPFD
jgi:predicted nucleic acid-binding protein